MTKSREFGCRAGWESIRLEWESWLVGWEVGGTNGFGIGG